MIYFVRVGNLWGPEKINDPCGKTVRKGAINEVSLTSYLQ